MNFAYQTPWLGQLVQSKRQLEVTFGHQVAVLVCQRMFELAACDCWETVLSLPHFEMALQGSNLFVIPIPPSHRIRVAPFLADPQKGDNLTAQSVMIIAIEADK
jgi:hypothetical protein